MIKLKNIIHSRIMDNGILNLKWTNNLLARVPAIAFSLALVMAAVGSEATVVGNNACQNIYKNKNDGDKQRQQKSIQDLLINDQGYLFRWKQALEKHSSIQGQSHPRSKALGDPNKLGLIEKYLEKEFPLYGKIRQLILQYDSQLNHDSNKKLTAAVYLQIRSEILAKSAQLLRDRKSDKTQVFAAIDSIWYLLNLHSLLPHEEIYPKDEHKNEEDKNKEKQNENRDDKKKDKDKPSDKNNESEKKKKSNPDNKKQNSENQSDQEQDQQKDPQEDQQQEESSSSSSKQQQQQKKNEKQQKEQDKNKDKQNKPKPKPITKTPQSYEDRNKDLKNSGTDGESQEPYYAIGTNAPVPLKVLRFAIFEIFDENLRINYNARFYKNDQSYKLNGQEKQNFILNDHNEIEYPIAVPSGYRPIVTNYPDYKVIEKYPDDYYLVSTTQKPLPQESRFYLVPEDKISLSASQLNIVTKKSDIKNWPQHILDGINYAKIYQNKGAFEISQALAKWFQEVGPYEYSSSDGGVSKEVFEKTQKAFESLTSKGMPKALVYAKLRRFNCDGAARLGATLLRDYFQLPTRIAAGYTSSVQSKGFNLVDLTDPMHAWVEVFIDGHWVPFDFTPMKGNPQGGGSKEQPEDSKDANDPREKKKDKNKNNDNKEQKNSKSGKESNKDKQKDKSQKDSKTDSGSKSDSKSETKSKSDSNSQSDSDSDSDSSSDSKSESSSKSSSSSSSSSSGSNSKSSKNKSIADSMGEIQDGKEMYPTPKMTDHQDHKTADEEKKSTNASHDKKEAKDSNQEHDSKNQEHKNEDQKNKHGEDQHSIDNKENDQKGKDNADKEKHDLKDQNHDAKNPKNPTADEIIKDAKKEDSNSKINPLAEKFNNPKGLFIHSLFIKEFEKYFHANNREDLRANVQSVMPDRKEFRPYVESLVMDLKHFFTTQYHLPKKSLNEILSDAKTLIYEKPDQVYLYLSEIVKSIQFLSRFRSLSSAENNFLNQIQSVLKKMAQVKDPNSSRQELVERFYRDLPGDISKSLIQKNYPEFLVPGSQDQIRLFNEITKGQTKGFIQAALVAKYMDFFLISEQEFRYKWEKSILRTYRKQDNNQDLVKASVSDISKFSSWLLKPEPHLDPIMSLLSPLIKDEQMMRGLVQPYKVPSSHRPLERKLFFIQYDISGSMGGDKARIQASAIAAIIDKAFSELDPFGEPLNEVVLMPCGVKCHDADVVKTKEQAMKMVSMYAKQATQANEGTNIQNWLDTLFAEIHKNYNESGKGQSVKERLKLSKVNYFLLTDGEAKVDQEKVLDDLNNLPKDVQLLMNFVGLISENKDLENIAKFTNTQNSRSMAHDISKELIDQFLQESDNYKIDENAFIFDKNKKMPADVIGDIKALQMPSFISEIPSDKLQLLEATVDRQQHQPSQYFSMKGVSPYYESGMSSLYYYLDSSTADYTFEQKQYFYYLLMQHYPEWVNRSLSQLTETEMLLLKNLRRLAKTAK